jgi:hypothetical protein
VNDETTSLETRYDAPAGRDRARIIHEATRPDGTLVRVVRDVPDEDFDAACRLFRQIGVEWGPTLPT